MENKYQNDRSIDVVKKLYDVYEKKYKLEDELSQMNSIIKELEFVLYDKFEQDGITKIEFNGILFERDIKENFKLNKDIVSESKWDDVNEWFNWLKSTGNGELIQTKTSVNSNTRTAFLRRWVADGKPLPDFIEESFFTTVKHNKSAFKRKIGVK